MFEESSIIYYQFTASIFMCTDYFLNNDQKDIVNSHILKAVNPIDSKLNSEIKFRVQLFTKELTILIISLVFTCIGWLGLYMLPVLSNLTGSFFGTTITGLILLGLAVGCLPRLFVLIPGIFVPILFAYSGKVITQFLIRCPKGSVFGIGFIFLMFSFGLRFYYGNT